MVWVSFFQGEIVRKLVTFAFGVMAGYAASRLLSGVTMHNGTCEENIASWNTWGQDTKGQRLPKTEDEAK